MKIRTPNNTSKLSPQYFNPYYSSTHLLFQFILSEFLAAYREMNVINASSASDLHSLETHISKLSGSSQHYMRLLHWNDDGYLTKMKNYCALLSQNNLVNSKNHLEMHHEADQTWLLSLQILDMARLSLEESDEKKLKALSTALQQLNTHLQAFGHLLMQELVEFKHDENIIFFLISQKEQLDVYKPGCAKELLTKMFGKDLQKAHQFLTDRYSARGFNTLLPLISTKIAEL